MAANSLSGKKLKRRLEDLERRAGSSSASPEQPHAVLASASTARPKETEAARKRRSKIESPTQKSQKSPSGPLPHNLLSRDDMFARQHTRQISASPPPTLSYGYSGPEQHSLHPSYPQHAAYHNLPTPYSDHSSQPLYLPPLPVSLPSMSLYDGGSVKQENSYADEMLNQYNMGYSNVGSMDVPTSQSYSDPNAYVNNPEYSFQVLEFLLFRLAPYTSL